MVLTGAQMRVARTRAGLTQAQLAKILGRSRSFVALVEQGRRILGEDDARKLRELLDVQGEL